MVVTSALLDQIFFSDCKMQRITLTCIVHGVCWFLIHLWVAGTVLDLIMAMLIV